MCYRISVKYMICKFERISGMFILYATVNQCKYILTNQEGTGESLCKGIIISELQESFFMLQSIYWINVNVTNYEYKVKYIWVSYTFFIKQTYLE